MKTKIGIFAICACLITACSMPSFVPEFYEVGISPKGSHITVNVIEHYFKGELIMVDTSALYVLNSEKRMDIIPRKRILGYRVHYANGPNVSWFIPIPVATSAAFGYYALLAAPINLLVALLGVALVKDTYSYSQQDLPYQQLSAFARFPQGLPSNVNLGDVR